MTTPPFSPPRPRAHRYKLGLQFENSIEKYLKQRRIKFERGPWFEFEDISGYHCCQPDFIVELISGFGVIEAKHTWTKEAHEELNHLYLPVVSTYYNSQNVIPIVAFKNFTPETPRDFGNHLLPEIEKAFLWNLLR